MGYLYAHYFEEIPIDNLVDKLRRERGWSQQYLAECLGVSRQTVNSIERRRYDPSLDLAFKIAEVFEQPIEAIFKPDEQQ